MSPRRWALLIATGFAVLALVEAATQPWNVERFDGIAAAALVTIAGMQAVEGLRSAGARRLLVRVCVLAIGVAATALLVQEQVVGGSLWVPTMGVAVFFVAMVVAAFLAPTTLVTRLGGARTDWVMLRERAELSLDLAGMTKAEMDEQDDVLRERIEGFDRFRSPTTNEYVDLLQAVMIGAHPTDWTASDLERANRRFLELEAGLLSSLGPRATWADDVRARAEVLVRHNPGVVERNPEFAPLVRALPRRRTDNVDQMTR